MHGRTTQFVVNLPTHWLFANCKYSILCAFSFWHNDSKAILARNGGDMHPLIAESKTVSPNIYKALLAYDAERWSIQVVAVKPSGLSLELCSKLLGDTWSRVKETVKLGRAL